MNNYGAALFHTTSAALRAEKTLKGAGLAIKLIPTPRELSSDCGLAIRFDWEQVEAVKAALEAAHVEVGGVHRLGG